MERWKRGVKSVLTGVICMVQLCFSSSALSAGTVLPGGFVSPDKGVLCNGGARVCYSKKGISIWAQRPIPEVCIFTEPLFSES